MSEREVITREAVGTIEGTGDGRTLDLRVVPYGVVARVTDNGRDFYEEVWEPGCFDKQIAEAHRVNVKPRLGDEPVVPVLMNFEHERGIGGVIGRGKELRDETDGLHGTFRMLKGSDADKALELVNEKVLRGVSLEAEPKESVRDENGVVRRVKARLVNIALCRSPAFEDAQVLAVREKLEEVISSEDHIDGRVGADINVDAGASAPVVFEPEVERSDVDEILERIGYEPLISRAVTKKPWNGSPSRFEDDEYKRSCLIDRGGDAPVKERCSLPVLEPNGDINTNALAQAAARINQVKASAELKTKAARKLIRYYRTAGMPPPPALQMMAAK